jgi:hypothetical protein
MKKPTVEEAIVALLKQKAGLKQHVFDITFEVFNQLKQVLEEIATHYNGQIKGDDSRIKIEYHDKGEFVALLRVAGDMLVFYMHSNIFEFDRDDKIWNLPYVQNDPLNSYVGQILIYNFLNDSFRYNRNEDLGYLVVRLYVNKENHFFVEGKRQRNMGMSKFGSSVIDKESIRKIVEAAILYSLQFDLLVQPYDDVKIVSLMQVNEEIMNSRVRTGKRLGFQYNSDDVR